MDQFGALGPQANNYFFNIKNAPTIKDDKTISRFIKPGLTAYKRNIEDNKFINLFKQANDGWNLTQKNNWFGNTYQTTCPSTWGTLFLNTHINNTITKHIHTSIRKLRNTEENNLAS